MTARFKVMMAISRGVENKRVDMITLVHSLQYCQQGKKSLLTLNRLHALTLFSLIILHGKKKKEFAKLSKLLYNFQTIDY